MDVAHAKRTLKKPIPSYLPLQNGDLNVEVMLKDGLPLFNGDVMREAVNSSFKKNECSGGDVKNGDRVPTENCYHMELVTVLRQVLFSIKESKEKLTFSVAS